MKKIIKLTESDLNKIVKRIVKEYFYEDDDDAYEDYVNDRDKLSSTVMRLLKPYYEKHGLEITLDFIDDIKLFVSDSLDDDPFAVYN
jgi:hypothetical protein